MVLSVVVEAALFEVATPSVVVRGELVGGATEEEMGLAAAWAEDAGPGADDLAVVPDRDGGPDDIWDVLVVPVAAAWWLPPHPATSRGPAAAKHSDAIHRVLVRAMNLQI